MRETIFTFLYGAGAILGFPIAVFWGRTSWKRYQELKSHELFNWQTDRYLAVTLAFTFVTTGVTITHFTRTLGNLQFGLSPILSRVDAYPMAAGLTILLLGFMWMVRLIDLENNPPKYRWTIVGLGLSVVWLAIVTILELTVGL